MKFTCKVHSIGNGHLHEEMVRSNGQKINVPIPALVLELVADTLALRTVTLLVGEEDAQMLGAGNVMPGAEWVVEINPVKAKE